MSAKHDDLEELRRELRYIKNMSDYMDNILEVLEQSSEVYTYELGHPRVLPPDYSAEQHRLNKVLIPQLNDVLQKIEDLATEIKQKRKLPDQAERDQTWFLEIKNGAEPMTE